MTSPTSDLTPHSTWRIFSCYGARPGSTQCQISCLGTPRHKNLQQILSFSERDDFFITLHGDGFLLGQLFAESTETEAITLSGPELSELVGQTNFLRSCEQHSPGDSQSLPLGYSESLLSSDQTRAALQSCNWSSCPPCQCWSPRRCPATCWTLQREASRNFCPGLSQTWWPRTEPQSGTSRHWRSRSHLDIIIILHILTGKSQTWEKVALEGSLVEGDSVGNHDDFIFEGELAKLKTFHSLDIHRFENHCVRFNIISGYLWIFDSHRVVSKYEYEWVISCSHLHLVFKLNNQTKTPETMF